MVRLLRKQPFGIPLFTGIFRHSKAMGYNPRTVMVMNDDPEEAMQLLNRLMTKEGLVQIYRRTKNYEKPKMQRKRISLEVCKAFYDEDMSRKLKFLLRKDRPDPLPGIY